MNGIILKDGDGEEWNRERAKDLVPILRNLIPSDAKSAFDIGSGRMMEKNKNFVGGLFDKYICLDTKNADIEQDLNINTKINLPNNFTDIVILSNILEHLINPIPIVSEANRISKKYLIIGLPNEYPLSARLHILFGVWDDRIYSWGHKHKFSIKSAEKFIILNWHQYLKRVYKFNSIGTRFIPLTVRNILIKLFPTLFVGEVFYLVKKSKIKEKDEK